MPGESTQRRTVCSGPCTRWLTTDLHLHPPLRCAWTSQRQTGAAAAEAARQLLRLHRHSSRRPCSSRRRRPRSRHSSSSQPPLPLCHQVLLSVVWSSCSLNLVGDRYDLNSLVMSDPPQALTLACCLPAEMSHTLDFEGSPATAARITVHSPALRGSRAGACSMSATHDTVTFRLGQQQLEVQ